MALSWAVSGCLTLLADKGFAEAGENAWDRAEEQFSRAAALAPFDAALGNLEMVAVVHNRYLLPVPEDEDVQLESRMLRVSGLDPGNGRLLGNLESLYALLLQEGAPPGTEDDTNLNDQVLKERLEFVKGLR